MPIGVGHRMDMAQTSALRLQSQWASPLGSHSDEGVQRAFPGNGRAAMGLLLLLLAAPCVAYCARQSVSLAGGSGSASIPNRLPFNSVGSYWIDYRVTGWSIPSSGCQPVVQFPISSGSGQLQIRVCAWPTGWPPFILYASDADSGGVPLNTGPPHITIAGATATNPMVLTLAATPFPIAMAVGSTITIASATGTGCAGMKIGR